MIKELKSVIHDVKTPIVTIKTGVELAMEIIEGYKEKFSKHDYVNLERLLKNALIGVEEINNHMRKLSEIVKR